MKLVVIVDGVFFLRRFIIPKRQNQGSSALPVERMKKERGKMGRPKGTGVSYKAPPIPEPIAYLLTVPERYQDLCSKLLSLDPFLQEDTIEEGILLSYWVEDTDQKAVQGVIQHLIEDRAFYGIHAGTGGKTYPLAKAHYDRWQALQQESDEGGFEDV